MNRREAAEVVAILRTAGLSVDDVTIEVWYASSLANIDHEEGKRVALALVAESDGYPKPATFNSKRRELRASLERADLRPFAELPPPPSDPDAIKRHMAEIRETLSNADGPLTRSLRRTGDQ